MIGYSPRSRVVQAWDKSNCELVTMSRWLFKKHVEYSFKPFNEADITKRVRRTRRRPFHHYYQSPARRLWFMDPSNIMSTHSILTDSLYPSTNVRYVLITNCKTCWAMSSTCRAAKINAKPLGFIKQRIKGLWSYLPRRTSEEHSYQVQLNTLRPSA